MEEGDRGRKLVSLSLSLRFFRSFRSTGQLRQFSRKRGREKCQCQGLAVQAGEQGAHALEEAMVRLLGALSAAATYSVIQSL